MDAVQECDGCIQVQASCPRRCAVLKNQAVIFRRSSGAVYCDGKASGAVSTRLDVNVRSVNSGQDIIIATDTVLTQRDDCGVTQGEAIVVGIVNADIDRNCDAATAATM